jgi:hypothetical protein
MKLMNELRGYPAANECATVGSSLNRGYAGVLVPLKLITESGVLAFFSATTVFGTPVDITLSELALETFFPANSATADALRKM